MYCPQGGPGTCRRTRAEGGGGGQDDEATVNIDSICHVPFCGGRIGYLSELVDATQGAECNRVAVLETHTFVILGGASLLFESRF